MPPDNQDEPLDMDADSSAAPALDEADATATQANADAPADSSTATDETEVDNLSVVRDVVAKEESQPAEAASSAEGEDGEGADEPQTGEQDDENYSDVPFNQHPRFQQLLRKAKTFEQDAGRYRNVENFLGQVNLTAEEAADTMTIAGLAKTDPVKAWEQIQPWLQTLAVAAGVVLPQDLEQQVTEGKLTREAALEVSKARAVANSANARVRFDEQRRQNQQQAELGRTLRDTAQHWLNGRRIKDPNFAAKEARLHERIVFLQRTEGVPNTVDGVKAQLKKAYDAINKEIGSITRAAPANANAAAPARKPAIKPVTGGSVAASASQAKPTSTLEAIRRVRQRATA